MYEYMYVYMYRCTFFDRAISDKVPRKSSTAAVNKRGDLRASFFFTFANPRSREHVECTRTDAGLFAIR